MCIFDQVQFIVNFRCLKVVLCMNDCCVYLTALAVDTEQVLRTVGKKYLLKNLQEH